MRQTTQLGDRIKALRGDQNQEDFSQLIGINRNSLRAYEKGRSQPNAEILASICSNFCVNPQWLLLGDGPMRLDGKQAQGNSEETGNPVSEMEAVRQENRDLRQENRELRQENRALLKENADLRVAVAELKPRAAPSVDTTDEHDNKAARKSA